MKRTFKAGGMNQRTLKAGDTLTIPKGWEVIIRNGEVWVRSPECSVSSRRGFSIYEFFADALKEQGGKE